MSAPAVLFDLDDTLFDDAASMRAGLGAVAEAYGCSWTPEHLFQRHRELIAELDPLVFSGRLNACGARLERFGRLLAEWQVTGPDPDRATKLYRRAYVGAYAECEGARATLQTLRGQGWRVGVLTNYLREVQTEKLERLGLLSLVDVFLCVTTCPPPSPTRVLFWRRVGHSVPAQERR